MAELETLFISHPVFTVTFVILMALPLAMTIWFLRRR